MWKNVLQWLRARFDTESGGDRPGQRNGEGSDPVGLYECPDCGTVYITNDPEPCSGCDSDVENVPNERDLGLKTKL